MRSSLLFGFAAALLCFIFFLSFVSFSQARSSVWISDLTDAHATEKTGWSGVAVAYLTRGKGLKSYRLSLFGLANCRENITAVYWMAPGSTNFSQALALGRWNSVPNEQFAVTTRFNLSVAELLYSGKSMLVITTRSNPTGAISGYLFSGANNYFASLSGAGEVPPLATSASGLGIAYLTYAETNSTDIIQISSNRRLNMQMNIRILHTSTNVTHEAVYGPSDASHFGPQLIALQMDNYVGWYENFSPVTDSLLNLFQKRLAYMNVITKDNAFGELRGQIYQINLERERHIPAVVQTQTGTLFGFDSSLKRRQQVNDNKFNPRTYVRLTPDSLGIHRTVFVFQLEIPHKNVNVVRGFQLDISLFGQMPGEVWRIDILNIHNGRYELVGYYTTTRLWRAASIPIEGNFESYFDADGAVSFAVSTNNGTGSLLIDQFAGRAIVPHIAATRIVRTSLHSSIQGVIA